MTPTEEQIANRKAVWVDARQIGLNEQAGKVLGAPLLIRTWERGIPGPTNSATQIDITDPQGNLVASFIYDPQGNDRGKRVWFEVYDPRLKLQHRKEGIRRTFKP